MYVKGGKGIETWPSIFKHLREILLTKFATPHKDISYKAVRNMYSGKLYERLETMQNDKNLAQIVSAPYISINGRKIDNLPILCESIEYEVDKIASNAKGSIVHGDFCFSNILYDIDSHVCRFIDPRGSFGGKMPGIEGDIRYDIAKLWHSVDGMYDFITADKFAVKVRSNTDIELAIHAGAESLAISREFANIFFSTWSQREIEIICGLMLCSIPALHYDHPNRQVAMYVRGLQLLNDGLNS